MGQCWEACSQAFIVGSYQWVCSCQSREEDVIAQQHEMAWTICGIHTPSCIADDKYVCPEHVHHTHREGQHRGWIAFVEVETALHDDDWYAFEHAYKQATSVPGYCGTGEMRYLLVGNRDGIF